MKKLFAAATIALGLASSFAAHAQAPFPPPPGAGFPGRDFGPAGPGYIREGREFYRRHPGPVIIVPEYRRVPEPYCPPPPRPRPLVGVLRFLLDR